MGAGATCPNCSGSLFDGRHRLEPLGEGLTRLVLLVCPRMEGAKVMEASDAVR